MITTAETFNEMLAERLNKISTVLGNKSKEYAIDGDRLHNFRLAARTTGQDMKRALWGMAMKHFVSVMDMVESKLALSEYMIDEKIGDSINYLILLESVMREELRRKVEGLPQSN